VVTEAEIGVEIEEEEEVEEEVTAEEVEEEGAEEDHQEADLKFSSSLTDCLACILPEALKTQWSLKTLCLEKAFIMKNVLQSKLMDRRLSTEYGIPSDPKSLHQSSEVFPTQASSQEPKSSIWVLLQELLFPMSQILLAQLESSMQLSSHTESAEI
jgi:hypothetical protein